MSPMRDTSTARIERATRALEDLRRQHREAEQQHNDAREAFEALRPSFADVVSRTSLPIRGRLVLLWASIGTVILLLARALGYAKPPLHHL